ncbi:MAG: hypothetical protein HY286_02050 [Planctomycetes bacterium]|nr:hypothetical protein [Planctomycetota bacterium]
MVFRLNCYGKKSKHAEPLYGIFRRTARDSGLHDYQAAKIVSFFLEHLADELADGNIIRIPAFGIFAPWANEKKCLLARGLYRAAPVFVPARTLRKQVALSAPYNNRTKPTVTRYRSNHRLNARPKKKNDKVYLSMQALRNDIERQLAE